MTRARDGQAGLTLIEIMISLLLVSVAAAFVFSIQMRTSTALRDQQAIAEMQQTLRSSSDQIVRDLRQAGYMARSVTLAKPGATGACGPTTSEVISGVKVDNDSGGPDELQMISADTSVMANVTSASFATNSLTIDNTTGLGVNDLMLIVAMKRDDAANVGVGCVAQITAIDAATKTLTFAPSTGANLAGNCQCTTTGGLGSWVVTRVNHRAYRIAPSDPRGLLQMSPTGGRVNDWVDMAVGIVDLQVALYVLDTATSTNSWFSGDNMEGALAGTNKLLTTSVTLVAKTTKEVNGVAQPRSPDVFEADAGADTNRVGDHAGTPLPVTDPSSMFYGDFVYRSYTSTVDMRNLGVGVELP